MPPPPHSHPPARLALARQCAKPPASVQHLAALPPSLPPSLHTSLLLQPTTHKTLTPTTKQQRSIPPRARHLSSDHRHHHTIKPSSASSVRSAARARHSESDRDNHDARPTFLKLAPLPPHQCRLTACTNSIEIMAATTRIRCETGACDHEKRTSNSPLASTGGGSLVRDSRDSAAAAASGGGLVCAAHASAHCQWPPARSN